MFDWMSLYLITFQNIDVSLQYSANGTASNVEIFCVIIQPVQTRFTKTLNDETQLYRVCSAEYVVLTSHGPNIVTTAVPVSHCVPILRAMRITVSHSLSNGYGMDGIEFHIHNHPFLIHPPSSVPCVSL